MVRKTNNPKTRMEQLRVRAEQMRAKPARVLADLEAEYCRPTFAEIAGQRRLKPEELWMAVARSALTLSDGPSDRYLRKLFQHYGHDPRDPTSWRMLLDYFAYVEFGEKRRAGTPKKWTAESRRALKNEINERGLQSLSAPKTAAKLRKDKTSKFSGFKRETLRQQILIARRG